MTLEPLLNAAPVIQVHAFAAMSAFVLGVVQLAAPKGTLPHRTVGWTWVALIAAVAISSFWIHGIRSVGPFGRSMRYRSPRWPHCRSRSCTRAIIG